MLSDQLTKPQKDLMFTHYFKNSNHKDVPKSRQDFILSSPGLSRTIILSQNSVIQFYRYSLQAFSEEENQVLARFGNVFEQSHTRFLDLKKAEAQAREAQVEAALERVRARSMAMHTTEEILDVVVVLFNQLRVLNIDFIQSWISIWHLDDGYMELWLSPIEGHGDLPIYHKRPSAQFEDTTVKSWLNGDRFSYLSLPGEDTVTEFLLGTDQILGGDYFKKLQKKNRYDRLEFVDANHRYGTVSMSCNTEIPEDDREILSRFAQVFEQTYTRFLDLQKAEAQAREAQIEAALERVRARSMAMHETSELQDVINTVYQQLRNLQVDISGGAFIAINSDIASELVCWAAGGSADYAKRVHVPFMDMPIYTELLEGIKKGSGFFEESFSHEEKQAFLKELFKNPPYSETPASQKKEVLSRPGGYTRSCFVSKHTSIFIINHHGRRFSAEDNKILRRMGKAFEQTYTRFLDLQRAEEQAWEAQVEVALEKVRSRSLAMHHSREMQQVANTVYQQLEALGIEMHAVGMSGVINPKSTYEVWVGGSSFDKPLLIPYSVSTQVQRDYNQAIEDRPPLLSRTYSGKKKKEYIDFLLVQNDFPRDLKKLMVESDSFSTTLVFQKNSGIQIARYTEVPYSDVENEILIRFSKVFEQAYIRFMDLAKSRSPGTGITDRSGPGTGAFQDHGHAQ